MEKNENQRNLIKVEWSEEISKKINTLNSTKQKLSKLSENEYFEPIKNNFESLNADIEKYIEDAKNPTYQIAIVGAIKAGKSSLINSLIGHELASVNVTPETASLTKFRYSEKNSLRTKFYKTTEWEKIWKNANEKNSSIFFEEYKELDAEKVKDIYLDKEEIFEEYDSIEEMKKDIAKWTSSQEKEHYFVKELEIGLSDLKLPSQICLVDTPGLNDVIDYRSEITRDYIDSANAVLVCVDSKALKNDEFVTIARVFSKARYKKDKVYILGTQIDRLNSKEDWEKNKKLWEKYLKEKEYFESKNMASEHIKGVSAYAYSEGIKLNEKISIEDITECIVGLRDLKILSKKEMTEKIKNIVISNEVSEEEVKEMKNRAISFSNIPSVISIIQNDLLENYNKDLIKDYKEKYKILKSKIDDFLNEHKENVKEKNRQLEMSVQELEKELEISEEKMKKIEKIQEKIVQRKEEIDEEFNNIFEGMNILFKEVEEEFKKIKL